MCLLPAPCLMLPGPGRTSANPSLALQFSSMAKARRILYLVQNPASRICYPLLSGVYGSCLHLPGPSPPHLDTHAPPTPTMAQECRPLQRRRRPLSLNMTERGESQDKSQDTQASPVGLFHESSSTHKHPYLKAVPDPVFARNTTFPG